MASPLHVLVFQRLRHRRPGLVFSSAHWRRPSGLPSLRKPASGQPESVFCVQRCAFYVGCAEDQTQAVSYRADADPQAFPPIHPDHRLPERCSDLRAAGGRGGRCDQRPAPSAEKRPFYRALFGVREPGTGAVCSGLPCHPLPIVRRQSSVVSRQSNRPSVKIRERHEPTPNAPSSKDTRTAYSQARNAARWTSRPGDFKLR